MRRAAGVFFNQLRGVWIPDETLFRVFDMASQFIILGEIPRKSSISKPPVR